MSIAQGTLLGGRYEVRDELGRGAVGVVHDGVDRRLRRAVAVKWLPLGGERERARLLAEAQTAARLVHPNVVRIYDLGEHENIPYIVMERLPGRTLADEMSEGALGVQRVHRIALEVLSALAEAHAAGIVHRDVKPGNMLISGQSVKVADFGIAKVAGLDMTATGELIGTPSYMAPEQFSADPVTERTDLFSLGVVLYEALAGRKPFTGENAWAVAREVCHEHPVPLLEARGDIAPSLAATVDRALAKDPRERFATAVEMAAALAEPVPAPGSDATVQLRPPDPTEVLPPRPRRKRLTRRRLLLAAMIAAAIVGVAAFGRSPSPAPDSPPPPAAEAGSEDLGIPPALDEALRELEEAITP